MCTSLLIALFFPSFVLFLPLYLGDDGSIGLHCYECTWCTYLNQSYSVHILGMCIRTSGKTYSPLYMLRPFPVLSSGSSGLLGNTYSLGKFSPHVECRSLMHQQGSQIYVLCAHDNVSLFLYTETCTGNDKYLLSGNF